jgi:hypothetical protein
MSLISNNEATTEAQVLIAALQQQDADAQVLMEKYSVAALSMSLAAQRADALTANNKAIAKDYDSDPNALLTKFENFLGVTPLLQTIQALDGDPTGTKNKAQASPKEALGNAMKQSNIQADIAASQQEALKHQMKQQAEDAQAKMIANAKSKQGLLDGYNKNSTDRLLLENQRRVQIQADLQHKALDIQLAKANQPDGTIQVVADNLVGLVPGSAPASQNPDGGVSKNIANAAAKMSSQTQTDLGKALSTIGSGAGLAMLAPLAKAVQNAYQALTGKTFDGLTAITPTTGAANGNV